MSTKKKEYMKKYYQEHKEQFIKRSLEYYHKHKNDPEFIERRKEAQRRYYQRHREEILKKVAENYRKNRQKILERMRSYQRNNMLHSNGKWMVVRKRLWTGICELCDKNCEELKRKLFWHHWNDEHPEWGIWVCYRCHAVAERIDKGLHTKYLELKEIFSLVIEND